jgi:hypothetical protein
LGHASYKAYRLLGVVHLVATGQRANLNDKVDFEQLPFLISPPMYAFYVIMADLGLPLTLPFTHEEKIFYPKSATSVRIQDATGFHDVPIAEWSLPFRHRRQESGKHHRTLRVQRDRDQSSADRQM